MSKRIHKNLGSLVAWGGCLRLSFTLTVLGLFTGALAEAITRAIADSLRKEFTVRHQHKLALLLPHRALWI